MCWKNPGRATGRVRVPGPDRAIGAARDEQVDLTLWGAHLPVRCRQRRQRGDRAAVPFEPLRLFPIRRPQVDVAVAASRCEPRACDGRDPGEGAHLASMLVSVGPKPLAVRGPPYGHATVRVTGGEQF